MQEKNIPKVLVLGALTPTDHGDSLSYTKLSSAVEKHLPFEYDRQRLFFHTEEGTLAEEEAARQIANQYLLMTAQKVVTSKKAKKIWADRYTRASEELYGTPDPEIASSLIAAEYSTIRTYLEVSGVDASLLERVLAVYESVIQPISGIHTEIHEDVYAESALKVRELLNQRYADIFETILSEDTVNTPEVIADKFERAIAKLAENDSVWKQWAVVIAEDEDVLSVKPEEKKVLIGGKRRIPSAHELKGLFAHEILVHVQRSVNGSHISDELAVGLPGYLDVEEGLGTFFEYAVTGQVPQKNIDRYVDVSLAVGVLGEKMSRNAMLEFALAREIIRLQASGDDYDEEVVNNKVRAHVNRIYRGTTGDDEIGVFTKDIVYYKGFQEVAEYIKDQLSTGAKIDDIMIYLLQGKFNPLDEKHKKYLQSHLA